MEENGGGKGPGMDVDERTGGVWVAGDCGEALGCGGSRDGVDGESKVGTRDEGVELRARDGGGEIENEEEEEEEEEGVFMDADMGRRQDVKEEVIDGAKMMEGGGRAGDDDVEGKMEMSTGHVRWETRYDDGDISGTEEEQREFRKEVESYYKQRGFEFRAPKFYKEELNLLKLYRAVIKLGGYEQATSCKLWRQVGAPFRPPKTCTTVSWTFRNFYEKALLEYEKHRMRCGELPFLQDYISDTKVDSQVNQASGSGRALRDAAARAMQGWQSHGLVNWEDGRTSYSPKSDKQLKGIVSKHKKPFDDGVHRLKTKAAKPQLSSVVVDVGPPADWVKINVYKINDCFEIYALVPGLLREEVHVQSDPAGRLIISGQPQQMDNPWGVTPFKKLVSLPSRIDPHQTSAVVTMNGQLYLRVPFEQKES